MSNQTYAVNKRRSPTGTQKTRLAVHQRLRVLLPRPLGERWTYKHADEPEQRLHRFIQNVGHFIFKVLRRDWHTVLCE